MLKLAIVRVDDTTGKKKILIEHPLPEMLAEEVHKAAKPGFRKRHVRRTLDALAASEERIRQMTIQLP